MFTTTEIKKLKEILSHPKKISIVSHRNPDGDAMGSSLGLLHFLQQLNHEVTFVSPNDFPDFLAWLPNAENTVIFEKEEEKAKDFLNSSELIFTLDFNALHRTGHQMGAYLETLTLPMVLIDHHELPDDYPAFTFSDTNYGSTCQMVYDFINALGYNHLIDKDVATCIYTGILTDSGGFRFPKTTPATHRCVAELIERGVNNSEVYNLLYDNSTYNRLQLLGRALQNLKVLPQYNASYITLSQKELDSFNYQKGDTEGIVNYGLTIKGIHLTAIFIENKEEGIVKISFRSQGSFDVNQFARNHFNGGGHINAAGGKSFSNLEETVNQFIAILAKEKA
ncbi:bifunctional oligoribonuclease/PAP phosphatase NrnA [Flavobacterium sp. NRK F10]|uniref:DHH family phosphoesterase n=1 Tax=Flavobacterium sp. NRK F10 TaxID=2954931 RepID=UPI002091A7C5|nr:bifunctional oligoribonuclease/PAP phosphatase NrnA [Flavobacterium sp. NRK F10]MCO6175691.1 bifunctional oligoribonuclease/PAP phosphatase NrnA [Flavobacterium sp. NRK F10]